MVKGKSFKARLQRPDQPGTWTYLVAPFNVVEVFGTRARVAVKGTVNGVSFRSSLLPQGEDAHILVVNKSIRDAAGVQSGDLVHIVLQLDNEPRTVGTPYDLEEALAEASVNHRFEAMSYSHKKEYVDWIESAKKPETRTRRVERAVAQ